MALHSGNGRWSSFTRSVPYTYWSAFTPSTYLVHVTNYTVRESIRMRTALSKGCQHAIMMHTQYCPHTMVLYHTPPSHNTPNTQYNMMVFIAIQQWPWKTRSQSKWVNESWLNESLRSMNNTRVRADAVRKYYTWLTSLLTLREMARKTGPATRWAGYLQRWMAVYSRVTCLKARECTDKLHVPR